MTHGVPGLCSWLFCGIELFEIFVGILVEGFDATFAAKNGSTGPRTKHPLFRPCLPSHRVRQHRS